MYLVSNHACITWKIVPVSGEQNVSVSKFLFVAYRWLLAGFHANLPAWLRRLEHSLSWFKLVLWNLALCIYIYEEVCLLSLIKAEEPSLFENQCELFSCPCKEGQLYFALTFWLMCSSTRHVSPADFTSHMSASVRANFLPFVSQAKGRSWEQRAIMGHGSLRAIISS